MSMGIEREVVAKIPKFEDIEVHASKVTAEGKEFFELREFIVSLGEYGKGLTLPISMLNGVLDAGLQMQVSDG